MTSLLHSFGRTLTHVNNSGCIIFNSTDSGTYSAVLGAGVYHIILIGAGGGGAHCRYGAGHDLFDYYGQGGVAATIEVYIRVLSKTTITITLGAHGITGNSIGQGQVSVYGTDGAASSITGIANTTLYCGPGTAGKVISGNQPSAGVMGDAVISGPTILRILMNSNEHRIASGTVASYVRNSNYMTNYYYGRGGGAVLSTNYDGGVPFCFIEKIEREQYGV